MEVILFLIQLLVLVVVGVEVKVLVIFLALVALVVAEALIHPATGLLVIRLLQPHLKVILEDLEAHLVEIMQAAAVVVLVPLVLMLQAVVMVAMVVMAFLIL
tara:strand:- start:181 stop:486 length:306 start_codon:yes stop_codon:yes gene_type:complete